MAIPYFMKKHSDREDALWSTVHLINAPLQLHSSLQQWLIRPSMCTSCCATQKSPNPLQALDVRAWWLFCLPKTFLQQSRLLPRPSSRIFCCLPQSFRSFQTPPSQPCPMRMVQQPLRLRAATYSSMHKARIMPLNEDLLLSPLQQHLELSMWSSISKQSCSSASCMMSSK